MGPFSNTVHGCQHRPQLQQDHGPPAVAWAPDGTTASGGSTGLPNLHEPNSSIVPGFQYGPRRWPEPQAIPWPSMVAEAVDINTDPGFRRATDPDMTLGSSLSLQDTMTPGGSTGH